METKFEWKIGRRTLTRQTSGSQMRINVVVYVVMTMVSQVMGRESWLEAQQRIARCEIEPERCEVNSNVDEILEEEEEEYSEGCDFEECSQTFTSYGDPLRIPCNAASG